MLFFILLFVLSCMHVSALHARTHARTHFSHMSDSFRAHWSTILLLKRLLHEQSSVKAGVMSPGRKTFGYLYLYSVPISHHMPSVGPVDKLFITYLSSPLLQLHYIPDILLAEPFLPDPGFQS